VMSLGELSSPSPRRQAAQLRP